MSLNNEYKIMLSKDYARNTETYKRLYIILSNFEDVSSSEERDNIYRIVSSIVAKYPSMVRVAYKALGTGKSYDENIPKLKLSLYGFQKTPHTDIKLYASDAKQFKQEIMYEFGFRLLQSMFGLYSTNAVADPFLFLTHVNTCILKGYMVILSWNELPVTYDINEALLELIDAITYHEYNVYYEAYASCITMSQLQEVCSFYRGIYIYKYLHDDEDNIFMTMNRMVNLSKTSVIIGERYFLEVARNIATTYNLYHKLLNPIE